MFRIACIVTKKTHSQKKTFETDVHRQMGLIGSLASLKDLRKVEVLDQSNKGNRCHHALELFLKEKAIRYIMV